MNDAKRRLAKNTLMISFLNIAKMIFPLLTLPYLTRVFSVDVYGVIAYSKACMGYAVLLIDFGFMLSGTREIIEVENNVKKISKIIIEITLGRLMLAFIGLVIVILSTEFIEILHGWLFYMIILYFSVVMNVFLFDYYFRAIEQMEIITARFVFSKLISVILTFIFVNSDADVMYVAWFDLISSICAAVISIYQIRQDGFILTTYSFCSVFDRIYLSFKYFLSTVAAQCFNGLNTILVGIFLTTTEVAYWSLSMQAIGVFQSAFNPIITSIYPYMLKEKDVILVKKLLIKIMPIILVFCIVAFSFGGDIIAFVLGDKYYEVGVIVGMLVPVLFFSFPAMLLGWPCLGVIKKVKEVTISTVFSAVIQLLLLLLLYYNNSFSLLGLVIIRNLTEINLFLSRFFYCWKFKNCLKGE